MTTKDFAETSDYMDIFHHETTTMLLPKKQANHGHNLKAEMNILTMSEIKYKNASCAAFLS